MRSLLNLIALGIVALGASACDNPGEDQSKGSVTPPKAVAADQVATKEVQDYKVDPPKNGDEVAVIETNHGNIVVKFFPEVAPKHVDSFKKLAKKKFYDGTKFHRVIPGFMIQGGDPNSKDDDRSDDGMGGPDYTLTAEFSDVKHVRGILSAARSGGDVNSAGSQFFIMVDDAPSLDNQYSAFGQVVSGMEVADKIVGLPKDSQDNPLPENPAIIKTVRVEKWPLKA